MWNVQLDRRTETKPNKRSNDTFWPSNMKFSFDKKNGKNHNLLYCINGVVIAAQYTATFLNLLCSPKLDTGSEYAD